VKSCLILLSTYNGEAWLEALLESLRFQDFPQWTLLVRDDASKDRTREILQSAAAQDPRIEVVQEASPRNLGAAPSFGELLRLAATRPEDTFLFCDQDDIWRHDKISKLLQKMASLPAAQQEAPLLLHSDLYSCSPEARIVNSSYHRYMNFHAEVSQKTLSHLLVQNFVVGCSVLFNRKLLDLAVPMPASALMHDWWLALLACSTGSIHFIDEPLVYYRIHEGNASQAGRSGLLAKLAAGPKKQLEILERKIRQAQDLESRLKERSPQVHAQEAKFLELFNATFEKDWLSDTLKLDLHMQGRARTLMLKALLLYRNLSK
jgi:hypothetical protein